MKFPKALGNILRFELLWKLLFFCLLNPLFSGAYHTYVSTAGLRFNSGIVWPFLSLTGGILFLVLFFGAAWLILYEYSVIIRILALCRQGEDFTLGQVMKASLWDMGLLRGGGLLPGAMYYVLLLPLVGIGYISTMAPKVTIPWFIFGEMQKTGIGAVGILAIYVAYHAIHLLLLFVPVDMALRHHRFGQAARASLHCWRHMGWRRILAVLGALIAWNRAFIELARYWRRNLLSSSDFDSGFFKYLLYSEAFRKDLLYWLLLSLLQITAMVGILWLLTAILSKTSGARASLQPAWGQDGAAVWEIITRRFAVWAARWKGRMKKRRWQLGAAALSLALIASLFLNIQNPLLVHRPFAIAHRGGEGGVENTLEAILSAAEYEIDYAEIDVQLTADGVPVLFHDGNLRRMAGRGENIGELTWEELQKVAISDNRYPDAAAPIASLEEVLQSLAGSPDMGLLIELKPAAGGSEALADTVIQLVERYEFGERAMFMSLDYLCLLPIMERHPEWWVGYCAYGVTGDIDDAVWRYQVDFLAVEEALVNTRLVAQARELNLPVYVWSVYDSEKMLQYLEMGISGIITDYPDEIAAVCKNYRNSHPNAEYIWQEPGLPHKEALNRW